MEYKQPFLIVYYYLYSYHYFCKYQNCSRVYTQGTEKVATAQPPLLPDCGRDNGGCEQECRIIRRRPRCSCREGYLRNPDRRTCSDLDECRQNNGGCSDICTNTPGSFTCSCRQGVLQDDQKTCSRAVEHCALNNGGCSQVSSWRGCAIFVIGFSFFTDCSLAVWFQITC